MVHQSEGLHCHGQTPRTLPELRAQVALEAERRVADLGRDWTDWPRLRLPVWMPFIELKGKDWLSALRLLLVSALGEGCTGAGTSVSDPSQLEVVAVRSRGEEMDLLAHDIGAGELTQGLVSWAGSTVGLAAVKDSAPFAGVSHGWSKTTAAGRWYAELARVPEPVAILEVAVAPALGVERLGDRLLHELRVRGWLSRFAAPNAASHSAMLSQRSWQACHGFRAVEGGCAAGVQPVRPAIAGYTALVPPKVQSYHPCQVSPGIAWQVCPKHNAVADICVTSDSNGGSGTVIFSTKEATFARVCHTSTSAIPLEC